MMLLIDYESENYTHQLQLTDLQLVERSSSEWKRQA